MNRRGFIRSFAALAAFSVTPKTFAKLAPTDRERLIAAMQTGVIRNQMFLLDGPIVMDVPKLIVNGCMFTFRNMHKDDVAITLKNHNFTFMHCMFDFGGAGIGIKADALPVSFYSSGLFDSPHPA